MKKWFILAIFYLCSTVVMAEDLSVEQQAMFKRINQFRSQKQKCRGKPITAQTQLVWNDKLAQAAQQHALDMAQNHYLAYDSPKGMTPWQRLRALGYDGLYASFALHGGYNSVDDAFHAWVNSASCDRVLMNEKLDEIGLVQVKVAGAEYDSYWVVYGGSSAKNYTDKQMLDAVNAIRSKARMCGDQKFQAALPLRWNNGLKQSAQKHAQDIAKRDDMTHMGSDGRNPFQRIKAHYAADMVAENIAAGQTTLPQVLDKWLQSAGHCKNLMNAEWREMGMAYAYAHDTENKIFWVQNFAAPIKAKAVPAAVIPEDVFVEEE